MLQARSCMKCPAVRLTTASRVSHAQKHSSTSKANSFLRYGRRNHIVHCRTYASDRAPVNKGSNSSFWKVAGGLAVLCGGGAAAGAYMYSSNPDFRNFVNKSLPIIETFNLALGPASNGNNSGGKSDETASMMRAPRNLGKPPKELASSDTEFKQLTVSKEVQADIISEAKPAKKTEPVASVSSIDQASISLVDLDIAESVEEEVQEVTKNAAVEPKTTPRGGGGSEPETTVASLSVIDQVGVSAVDIDIAQLAEKDVAEATGNEQSESVSNVVSQSVDTSLTDKEVDSMVEQTSVEVMIETALASLKELGHKAIAKQEQATDAIKRHVKHLREALEHTGKEDGVRDTHIDENVVKTQTLTEESVSTAKSAIVQVNEAVDKVQQLIKEAERIGAKEAAAAASESAARVSYDLQTAAAEVQRAKAETVVLGEHQKQLEESKEIFKKELETILPGVINETGKETTEEGLSSNTVLLAYARKRLEQLRQQLAEQQGEEQKRLGRALELQREQDNTLAQMVLRQEVDRLNADFTATLNKREAELLSKHETELRQQLRRQAAAYSDHLAEVLRVQAGELDRKFKEELEQAMNREKEAFDLKLQSMLARLRGVESVVESRADIEKRNKESQELWLACQSLRSAVSSNHTGPQSLASELNAVRDSALDDPVVTQVLVAVPEEASTRGVVSASHLQEKFTKIRRACRRMAMVGDSDSGLWTYFLSYVQSFLIFDSFDPVKEGEAVDLDNIDTFGLLARAEYYLRRGDLELAARFMNQLTGEPWRIAHSWVKDARLLLETKQAADFLAAYSAAAALSSAN